MTELTITTGVATDLREGTTSLIADAAEQILTAIEDPDRDRLPRQLTDPLGRLQQAAALLHTLQPRARRPQHLTIDPAAHQPALSNALAAALQLLASELAIVREAPDRHDERSEQTRLEQLSQRILELHGIARDLHNQDETPPRRSTRCLAPQPAR